MFFVIKFVHIILVRQMVVGVTILFSKVFYGIIVQCPRQLPYLFPRVSASFL